MISIIIIKKVMKSQFYIHSISGKEAKFKNLFSIYLLQCVPNNNLIKNKFRTADFKSHSS